MFFIQGLQKITLLDYPEHVACTVFLGGCDFRCPFCHNSELVTGKGAAEPKVFFKDTDKQVILSAGPVMEDKDFFSFLDNRKGLLDGVAITGGEPCLRHGLPEFIAKIKDKGFKVKLDTNGNHPDVLRKLVHERLIDYVAVDIKNSPRKYAETSGLMGLDLDPIKESIYYLIKPGEGRDYVDYEFRTTVIEEYHKEEDFHEIGELIRGAKRYFLQPFVDREHVPNHNLTTPSLERLNVYRDIANSYVEYVAIRGIEV